MSDRGDEELPEMDEGDETLPLDETQEPHDDGLGSEGAAHGQAEGDDDDEEDDGIPPLPPAKPWTGVFRMAIPLPPATAAGGSVTQPDPLAPAATTQTIRLAKDDSELPEWLSYVLNDDFPHFERAIFPPAPKKPKKKAAHHAEGDTAADEAAAEDPTAGGALTEEAGGDGEGGDDSASASGSRLAPNRLFYLHQTRDGTFTLRSRPDSDALLPASSPSPTAAAAAENEGGDDGDSGDVDEAAAAAAAAAAAEAAAAAAKLAAAQPLVVIPVDLLTLAMNTSADALRLMLSGSSQVSMDRAIQWATQVAASHAASFRTFFSTLIQAKRISDAAKSQQAAEAAAAKLSSEGKPPSTKPFVPPVHKLPAELLPLFTSLVTYPRLNAVIQRSATDLATIGVCPKAPLATNHLLTTADAVMLYLNVLLHVPRSQLLSWAQPVPQEGDEPIDEEGRKSKPLSPTFSQILLDLRRRAARRHHGKGTLKASASSVYRPHLAAYNAVLEGGSNATSAAITAALSNGQDAPKGQDSVLCHAYSPKRDGSLPTSLTLYESDLVLLLLGTATDETFGDGIAEDLAPLFESLLIRRASTLSKARRRAGAGASEKKLEEAAATGVPVDDDVTNVYRPALWHLLFQHVHLLTPACAAALLRVAPMGGILFGGPCGVARVKDFCERFCFEYEGRLGETSPLACEEAMERNQTFIKHLAKPFCVKFWPEFTSNEATMMSIERHGSTFLSILLAPSMEYSRLVRAIAVKPPLPEDQLLARLEHVSTASFGTTTAHPQTIFHAELMGVAVDCQNYTTVSYVAKRHGVVTCRSGPHAGELGLVEEALRRSDLNLLRVVVVDCGAKLNTLVRQGLLSGLEQLEDFGLLNEGPVTEAARQNEAAALALLQDWKRVEAERLADPVKRHGLLLSLPAAAV